MNDLLLIVDPTIGLIILFFAINDLITRVFTKDRDRR